ncbi:MAG: hypothetical protein HC806_05400 [Anaerolineae bacterium]|nr:hypothetical protein [Anaerolineae bacterium]
MSETNVKPFNLLKPSPMAQSHWPYIALGIGILSLAFGGIFVRWANAPGPVSSFYRMAIALVVLAYPFFRNASKNKLSWKGVKIAFLGGLFFWHRYGALVNWSNFKWGYRTDFAG